MGVFAGALLGFGDVDAAQHVDGVVHGSGGGEAAVELDGLGDLAADREDRVKGRHRLLEDHGDVITAKPAHFGQRETEQVGVAEADGAGFDAAGWGDEAHQGECGHALAAAGFADDGKGFAGVDVEREVVHGFDDAVASMKVGAEVGDGDTLTRRAARGDLSRRER